MCLHCHCIVTNENRKKQPPHSSEHPVPHIACSSPNVNVPLKYLQLTWCLPRDSAEAEGLCTTSGIGTLWLWLVTADKGLHSRFQIALPGVFFCLFYFLFLAFSSNDKPKLVRYIFLTINGDHSIHSY